MRIPISTCRDSIPPALEHHSNTELPGFTADAALGSRSHSERHGQTAESRARTSEVIPAQQTTGGNCTCQPSLACGSAGEKVCDNVPTGNCCQISIPNPGIGVPCYCEKWAYDPATGDKRCVLFECGLPTIVMEVPQVNCTSNTIWPFCQDYTEDQNAGTAGNPCNDLSKTPLGDNCVGASCWYWCIWPSGPHYQSCVC